MWEGEFDEGPFAKQRGRWIRFEISLGYDCRRGARLGVSP